MLQERFILFLLFLVKCAGGITVVIPNCRYTRVKVETCITVFTDGCTLGKYDSVLSCETLPYTLQRQL